MMRDVGNKGTSHRYIVPGACSSSLDLLLGPRWKLESPGF